MAFLDNTTAVFLDAVLTDLGRQRLAAANGTFRIESFSHSDDEIDYSATNPEDSPIMEALFNNSTANKYNLVSYTDNNLTHLPVIEIADLSNRNSSVYAGTGFTDFPAQGFLLLANQSTIEKFDSGRPASGVLYGNTGTLNASNTNVIRTEQGLQDIDNQLVDIHHTMQDDVYEVCVDSQIVSLLDSSGNVLTPNYVDDDLINYYYVNGVDESFDEASPIKGPEGTSLQLKLASSQSLLSDGFFTDRLSKTSAITTSVGTSDYSYLDTTVKVKGRKTGFVKNIPVRILKAV